MQTNRLDQLQNPLTSKLGAISQQPSNAEVASNIALQTATNVVSPELTTQPIIQWGWEQNIQQSQAPSTTLSEAQYTAPAELAIQTAQNIPQQRQKIVWNDVLISMQSDIQDGMPKEVLQEYYPEISPDIADQLYDDFKAWMPINEVSKYYPELSISEQVAPKDIQVWWLRTVARQWEWIIPSKTEWLANPYGAMFELVDNLVQQIPQYSPSEEPLAQRLNQLSQKQIDEYRNKFQSNKAIQKLYGNENNYIKEMQKSLVDKLLWVSEQWPNVAKMYANMPVSAIKTISAIARASSNPYDALMWLGSAVMLATQWKWPLIDRYGSWENFQNTLENDPIWVASDILSIVDPAFKWIGKWVTKAWFPKAWAKIYQVWEIAWWASTMWVPQAIDRAMWAVTKATKGTMLWPVASALEFQARPLQKTQEFVTRQIQWAKQKLLDKLLPENLIDRKELVNNPFVHQDFNEFQKQLENNPDLNVENFTESVLDDYVQSFINRRNQEIQTKYASSPAYQALENIDLKHDYTPLQDSFVALADKYNIWVSMVDGKPQFDFIESSLGKAEQSNIKEAADIIFSQPEKNTKSLMNNRESINNMINYDTWDPFKRWQSQFMRELRDNVDLYAKNAIPYFSELTALYKNQINKLNEAKGIFLNNDWTVKKTLYNQILNIDRPSNKAFRDKVIELDPSLPLRVRWLRLLKDLEKVKTSDKWLWWFARIFDAIWWAVWYSFFNTFLWWILGYWVAKSLEWFPLQWLKNLRYNEVLRLLDSVTDEQTAFVQDIARKKLADEEITKNDRARMELLVKQIADKVKALQALRKEEAPIKEQ